MRNKTQKQIADQAGITQGYLSKLLSGVANPTIDTLDRVSKAMGINIPSLIKKIEKSKLKVHDKDKEVA